MLQLSTAARSDCQVWGPLTLAWNRIQGSLLPLNYLHEEFYLPQVPGEQRVSSHYTFMRDAAQGDSGYFCSKGLAHSTSHL